jgi:hypothetical protein
MLLVGGVPAMFAINEMKHSFLFGNYLATIVVAQVFVEHTLGASFAMAGDDKTANAGCARLIDESVKRGWLDGAIANRLHELRVMRNPYTHSRSGVPNSYMNRLRDSATYDPHELAEADAREAIRIIVDWLRDGSPDWAPAAENVPWPDDPDADI